MRSSHEEEFTAWARAHQGQLLRAAYLVTGDPHTAEDVLQGALVKVALRWHHLRDENPDGFIRTVLYRDAISAWRRVARTDPVPDVPERAEATAPLDERAAQRLDLERLLGSLTAKQRAVIALRFFEDRSEQQCADILRVSVGTIKSQTHAALARLRVEAGELR